MTGLLLRNEIFTVSYKISNIFTNIFKFPYIIKGHINYDLHYFIDLYISPKFIHVSEEISSDIRIRMILDIAKVVFVHSRSRSICTVVVVVGCCIEFNFSIFNKIDLH